MKNERMITVGEILRAHGIRGELKVQVRSDYSQCFYELDKIFLVKNDTDNELIQACIQSSRHHKQHVLLKLDVAENRNESEKFGGWLLQVPEKSLPELEEDEYYVSDLVGLIVSTTGGKTVGELTGVFPGGLNDIYEIHNLETGKFNLVPAVREFIKLIDIKNGRMIIEPIEGLLD